MELFRCIMIITYLPQINNTCVYVTPVMSPRDTLKLYLREGNSGGEAVVAVPCKCYEGPLNLVGNPRTTCNLRLVFFQL